MIHVYTDGGVRPTNPGPGGWAYVAISRDSIVKTKAWWEEVSTNNRMELQAAIHALEDLKDFKQDVTVISDSIYLVNGAQDWIDRWVANDWRGSTDKPIQNVDLWRAIWSLKHEYADRGQSLQFRHIPGHSGDRWNDMVDGMATEMALFAAR